jgi:hypothetical protein
MYRHLEDRDTFERCLAFVRHHHRAVDEALIREGTWTIRCLDFISGSVRSSTEISAIRKTIDVLSESGLSCTIDPPMLHTLSVTLNSMHDAYTRDRELYAIVFDLFQGVRLRDVYETACRRQSDCPKYLYQLYAFGVLANNNTQTPLLTRVQYYEKLLAKLRKSVCYKSLREYTEKTAVVVREELVNELYLSYYLLEDVTLYEILTRLEIPEGVKSIIHECRWHKSTPNIRFQSMDLVYVALGTSLLFLIGLYCFCRFEHKSRARLLLATR